MPGLEIHGLDRVADLHAVADLLAEAEDYYRLWLGRPAGAAEVEDVFSGAPPGCDAAASQRLGLFLDGRLGGVAELSFGFPTAEDAYLGLMILAPRMRARGHGRAFLAGIETRARALGHRRLNLGVLEANAAGRAFWQAMGFEPTGVSRLDPETGHLMFRLAKPL